MGIKADRRRRFVRHKQDAMEDGDHVAEEAVRTIKEHLQAGAMDVSQPLLDADMYSYNVHV